MRISTAADLKSAAATLHDARFTAEAAAFDAAAGTFPLKCWTLEPRQKGSGAPRRWQACRLSFANVAECNIKTTEKVRYYELATIRFSERERILELVAHYGIQIRLTIGQLDGALVETKETRDEWD